MSGRIGFFDAGSGTETDREMVLELRRAGNGFQIPRRFGYWDPKYERPFLVPADPETFWTDLASIPWFFAWLVPGLGTHLPAVLLHDGLVVGRNEPATHIGPAVSREEADRIFRDAMKHLGTPVIRRWLIWTAVALATLWAAPRWCWWWRALTVLTFAVVIALGGIATLDLVDLWDVLPWMDDRPWWAELGTGAAFAVAVPAGLSVLWARRWRVAAITGVCTALLLHVTLAVLVVSGIYWVLEKVVSWPEGLGPNVADNLASRPRDTPTTSQTAPRPL